MNNHHLSKSCELPNWQGSQVICMLMLIVFCFLFFFNQVVQAQSTLSTEERSAVASIINYYLMDDEEGPKEIDIVFNGIDLSSYLITDNFEISLPQVNQDIEFCFVLSSRANLNLTINGVNKNLRSGENCFVITESNQSNPNLIELSYSSAGGGSSISIISAASTNPTRHTLPSLTRSEWNERVVRKVLKIFAFGGHARDSQITTWANMRPIDAIRQMLNFSEHNSRLSPMAIGERYTDTRSSHGTFKEFLEFIADDTSNLPIPVGGREQFGITGYRFDDGFIRMTTVRGLNPFRQRIGFWETNYHLAVNLNASVSMRQMVEYYDLIMNAHEANLPYYQIMGIAAKSAAVAMQYGHRENRWNSDDQICECNQDFAREIHQLFYGIFGSENPTHHENVTIPETAKMLTGMPVPYLFSPIEGFSTSVFFNQGVADGDHHTASVNILNSSIGGTSAANKIDNLMPISIQHPESLENLPIMIIQSLADDNLSDNDKIRLRNSWASLGVNRKLLDFIHAYAISDMFNDATQFKYLTSHERAIYLANKRNLDNVESYTGGNSYINIKGRPIRRIIEGDFAGPFFKPLHNVFGGQTATEASDSAVAFENNYNDVLSRDSYELSEVFCDDCESGRAWEKKWAQVLPRRNGNYYVEDVAEWLWMHAVGNMDNYTELERAHLLSILAAVSQDPSGTHQDEYFFDFNYLMCVVEDYKVQNNTNSFQVFDVLTFENWYNYPLCRENDGIAQHESNALNATLTGAQISNDNEIQSILSDLGSSTLPLNGDVSTEEGKKIRRYALRRIDSALDFIFTTPFVFAEGQ